MHLWPLFFRLKNGYFWDFSHFWGQNHQKSKSTNFQALEKGATFLFLRLKIFFSENFGDLDYFCILFHFLTPKTKNSRREYRGIKTSKWRVLLLQIVGWCAGYISGDPNSICTKLVGFGINPPSKNSQNHPFSRIHQTAGKADWIKKNCELGSFEVN